MNEDYHARLLVLLALSLI